MWAMTVLRVCRGTDTRRRNTKHRKKVVRRQERETVRLIDDLLRVTLWLIYYIAPILLRMMD